MTNSLLAFLVTIAVLILVHEWGHYRVAKACGIKVLRFSLGFGRPILRWQRGETEWVVGLLPFGGYVKMLDEREAPVAAEELHRAFNRKSLWQRSAVVAAGPLANLVLAVLLYAASYWIGSAEPRALLGTPMAGSVAERAGLRAGDWVRAARGVESSPDGGGAAVADDAGWLPVASLLDLRWQITRAALDGEDLELDVSQTGGGGRRVLRLALAELKAGDADAALMRRIGLGPAFAEPLLGEIVAGGPAERAGLRRGDVVLRIDGRVVPDAAALRATIRSAVQGAQTLTQHWEVRRGNQTLTLTVAPMRVEERGEAFGRIQAAVGGPVQMDPVRYGFVDGLQRGASRTIEMSLLTLKMFGRMVIGEASLSNISGPLTIADYAGQSAELGLAHYLGFLAVVSVSLGVLNLLPLPILDGGHLLYHLFEGVTRRPIPEIWLERLQRGGLAVILMMMSIALYNDVARLLGQH
ncbi:MAG TPA: RIP metalloprotease RseP [Burkholderiaceae bacterium]|nr:RIP metalloprotease RseP [Burkholderiaceae bacterium]HNG79481.1 RIP metalloprotease RseP [Burkholderiaceae bacterium]